MFGFIFYDNIKMKTTRTEKECVETKRAWRWKVLPTTAALLYALVGSPQEWYAKTMSGIEWWANQVGMTSPVKTDSLEKTITVDELKKDLETKEKKGIDVSGFIQLWTSIVPDFASICSDKPSMLLCIDATDKKSWLWVSFIRLDDFHSDPAYPVSKASVLVPHWSKTLWDGKWTVWASVECTYIDQMPDGAEIMPLIVWTYDTKDGWTFEGKYFHEMMKWPDADAFRLWITKKITDALSLTAQWWYKSDYDGKFFGRVVADVDLWGWFSVQVSWVAKDWKISPTALVAYKF